MFDGDDYSGSASNYTQFDAKIAKHAPQLTARGLVGSVLPCGEQKARGVSR